MNIVNESVEFYFQMFRLLNDAINEYVEFCFQMFRLLNDVINESVEFCFKTRLLNSRCSILF